MSSRKRSPYFLPSTTAQIQSNIDPLPTCLFSKPHPSPNHKPYPPPPPPPPSPTHCKALRRAVAERLVLHMELRTSADESTMNWSWRREEHGDKSDLEISVSQAFLNFQKNSLFPASPDNSPPAVKHTEQHSVGFAGFFFFLILASMTGKCNSGYITSKQMHHPSPTSSLDCQGHRVLLQPGTMT